MRIKGIQFMTVLAIVGFMDTVHSQIELPEDKVKATFSVQQNGCEATIIAKISMVEHWHINSVVLPQGSFGYASALNLEKSEAFKTVGGVVEPKAHVEFDDASGELLSYHEGTVRLKRKIKVVSEEDFSISGSFDFQTCDSVKCLPPYSYDFDAKVNGCSEEKAEVDEDVVKTFVENKDGIAKNKEGVSFVRVNDEWFEVPEGNSAAFYKKYLTLGGK